MQEGQNYCLCFIHVQVHEYKTDPFISLELSCCRDLPKMVLFELNWYQTMWILYVYFNLTYAFLNQDSKMTVITSVVLPLLTSSRDIYLAGWLQNALYSNIEFNSIIMKQSLLATLYSFSSRPCALHSILIENPERKKVNFWFF